MCIAGYYIVHLMPQNIHFTDALKVIGASGKLNVITTGFNDNGFVWKDKYNIISGIVGGFFLALSYFGTDHSQVGRYLTARNTTQSKLSLLMNGLVKVPMQFLILLLGALLFVFYQFRPAPVFFNKAAEEKVYAAPYNESLKHISAAFDKVNAQQKTIAVNYTNALKENGQSTSVLKQQIQVLNDSANRLRSQYKSVLAKADPSADTNDTNYIFLRFVIDNLPQGLIGLLIAIIFLASWSSIAAALNSLASCTMIDFYCRFKKDDEYVALHERQYKMSKWFTLLWGIFCIVIAEFANRMGSLIEAVNILGSLFYGVILGIFLVAFYFKKISGNAVFYSAIISEIIVVLLFILDNNNLIGLGFLWLNVAGALAVIFFGYLVQKMLPA